MAITIQEAQVIFSADGMKAVQTEAGKAATAMPKSQVTIFHRAKVQE